MRSHRVLPIVVAALVSVLFALPAAASTSCDEERAELELARADVVDELILPCAMVESGQLGPWCVDAAVYVVTNSGTLLCRVLLPAVELAAQKSSELCDREPSAPPETTAGSSSSCLGSAVVDDARAPLVSRVAAALERAEHAPRAVDVEPPFVPG